LWRGARCLHASAKNSIPCEKRINEVTEVSSATGDFFILPQFLRDQSPMVAAGASAPLAETVHPLADSARSVLY